MSYVKVLNIPDDKNVYIIGDIHGCYTKYKETLKHFGITDDDIVISTGDVIDRGIENKKCLDEFLKTDNRYMVLGNHEFMMMNRSTPRWNDIWLRNGGDKLVQELSESEIEEYCEVLKDIPMVLEINHRGKKIGVIHAGTSYRNNVKTWDELVYRTDNDYHFRDNLIWEFQSYNDVLDNAYAPDPSLMQRNIDGINLIVNGHIGVPFPFKFGNRIWIDTDYISNAFTLVHIQNDINNYLQRQGN